MSDLNVKIGADISAYKAGLTQAGTIAQDFSSEATKSLAEVAKANTAMGGSAQSMSMRFMQMRSGLSAVRDGAMGAFVGGQRADMMFMAMGHHFTSLINETGSLKGAFSALGASLMGAGGVIIGLTLAYELFQHFSKAAKEADNATRPFLATLENVKKATLEGNQEGTKEIIRLKLLYEATQNHNLSLKDRNKAYDELEAKYPKFFTNADREKTLLGQNAIGYENLAKAIMAAAMAKAYENQIGTNTARSFENDQKILAERKKQMDIMAQINKLKSERESETSGREGLGGSQAGIEESSLINKLADSYTAVNNLKTDSGLLSEQNGRLAALALNSEMAASFKTTQEIDAKNKKLKEQKDAYQLLEIELKKVYSLLAASIDNDYLKNQGRESQNTINLTNQYEKLTQQLNQINIARKAALDLYARNEQIRTQGSVFGAPKTGGDSQANAKIDNTDYAKQQSKDAVNSILNANAQILSGVQDQYDRGLISIRTYLEQKYFLEESNLNQERSLYDVGTKQYAEYTDKMTSLTAAYDKNLKKSSDTTKADNKILMELSTTIGDGLMKAFENAMQGTQSFIQAMGRFLEQLIEKLIAAAAAALILSLIIAAFTGGAALGAFGALFGKLSGLGSIVSSSSNTQTLPTHATGGIFTRAHVGVFGEAGPEAIVTPKHLAEFAGVQHGGGDMSIQHTFKGADLIVWYGRAVKQNGRLS